MGPIGVFHSFATERYQVARQPGLEKKTFGTISLFRNFNFEQALDDLEGFERIWVIFQFHRNAHWRPKVLPPRGGQKRGVFATRSPHRPNPIGLSSVELIAIDGLDIMIGSHDLLDQTPILDIKPYVPAIDSFPMARAGWTDTLPPEKKYTLTWLPLAKEQAAYISSKNGPDLEALLHCRLTVAPEPYPGRRIKSIQEGFWELSFKTWRLHYLIEKENEQVIVTTILSGYLKEELQKSEDTWRDKELHRSFQKKYGK